MDTTSLLSFDPILIASIVLMQVGAKHLDLELTEFQKTLIKNQLIQAIILFGIIYIPIRDVFKTFIIVAVIYLTIYVLFNENNKYNVFSKQWLYTKGIIKEYNNLKDKYYKNISKLM
jgi:hypothetical protein